MNADLQTTNDGRWIIGRGSARPCPNCGAEPVTSVAANGRAEIWHTPFECCEAARQRNRRLRMGDSDHQARQERALTIDAP